MSATTDAVVVGAGAAGLTAAYHLQKAGLSVKVLEASDRFGGRLRKDESLADFPIDMGGSWIHGRSPRKILNPILDEDVTSRVETILHDVGRTSVWTGRGFIKLPPDPTRRWQYWGHKWVGSTWWDFFNDHIVETLRPGTIVLSSPVASVDYRHDPGSENDGGGGAEDSPSRKVKVTCANGDVYQALYVVITVSMKMIQDGAIVFTPALPKWHRRAISKYRMGPALKVYMKFRRRFYPSPFLIGKDLVKHSYFRESSARHAQRDFWDETYGQDTGCHVLGMFCYGRVCDRYVALFREGGERAVIDSLLSELDALFDGQASECHEGSAVAIWPEEPFVRTGYTQWVDHDEAIEILQSPVGGRRVFLAGEAVPVDRESWGFAHGAAMSGKEAARKIVELRATGRFAPTKTACCGIL